MTWYVVCWHDEWDDPANAPADYRSDRAKYEELEIWTISRDPKQCGWETDCGCPGYGLTYTKANAIVGNLNMVEDKTLRYVPVLKIGEDFEFASRRMFATKGEADFGHGTRVARLLIPESTD